MFIGVSFELILVIMNYLANTISVSFQEHSIAWYSRNRLNFFITVTLGLLCFTLGLLYFEFIEIYLPKPQWLFIEII